MSKLSLLDFGFFVAETEASPKHVGGLLICKRPARSSPGYAKSLYQEYLGFTDVKAPFNKCIHLSLTAYPRWKTVTVDVSKHIFFHTLDKNKNDRQGLYELVSELHTPMLDRSRPLWEMHVIDGLADGRFAMYYKMHHAYADGVTMSSWMTDSFSASADDLELLPIWTLSRTRRERKRAQLNQELLAAIWKDVVGGSRRFFGVGRLATMLFLESIKLTKNAIALPFVSSAKTPLTGQVTAGRQFATAAVSMERVNKIRTRTRSTLNHVALTCLDGALRSYLNDLGIELNRPITIQMPVNLRKSGENSLGNKIGIIQVELSAPTDDPYVRLRNIGYSLRNVRTMVDSVAPEAIESYTLITNLVAQIAETLRLSNHMPPMGNTLVSNVPGPKDHLYIKGACLEEMHPISTLPPSNLLNITLFSYAGELYFGMIATDELPHLDQLAHYIGVAFSELEDTVLHNKG
ncbi:MAG: DUF1298 domain-containing protein [Burkholderiales bacterium]|nr:DUF1298 domain-containing protein [Rhodoferax sp.]MBK9347930.1 DUF1298 domain-containing protein [Burkholderiales bacterium]